MSYEVELPDGTVVDVPDDVPLSEARKRIEKAFPQFAQNREETSGFFPAVQGGIAGLKGAGAALAGRLGLMDPREAEAYRAEKDAERDAAFTPTEDSWGESPWLKMKELAGQSLPYMAVPLAAGAGAAMLPVAAPAALMAGAGAGLASTAMFTGTNLDRQLEEAKRAGKPVAVDETELLPAVGAAIPQALLDVVSFRAAPLIRRLFTSVGKELTEDAALALAKKGFVETAKDYAVSTGKAAGVEGATEAAQQFLERAQAGLKIADPEARAEYIESFIGGAALGGALAPAGRYIERMGEQQKAANAERLKTEKARAEEAKAAEQALTSQRSAPGYMEDLAQRYDAKMQQLNALREREKALKAAAKADPASAVELQRVIRERKVFESTEMSVLAREVADAGGAAALKKRMPLKPEFAEGEPQAAIPGMEPAGTVPQAPDPAEGEALLPRIRQAEQAVEDAQTVYSEADETAAPAARKRYEQAAGQLSLLRKALQESGYKPPAPAPKAVDVEKLRKQRAEMRGPAFDPVKAAKLEDRIAAAQQANAEADKFAANNQDMPGADSDFFAPEAKAGRAEERAQRVYGETYQGREADADLQQQEVRDTTGAKGYLESMDELPAIEQQIKDEKSEAAFARMGEQARVPPAQPDMFTQPGEPRKNLDSAGRRQQLTSVLKTAPKEALRDPQNRALLRRIIDNIDDVGTDAAFFEDVAKVFNSDKRAGVLFELQRIERKLDNVGRRAPAAPREAAPPQAPPAQRRLLAALERPARDADPAMLERIRDNVAFLAQERPEGRGRDIQAHALRYITQGPQALSVAEQVTLKQALDLADEGKTSETGQQELPLRQPLPGLPQTDERGARFDSFEAMDQFLASDLLKDVRGEGDTASRVARMVPPLEGKIAALRAQIDKAKKLRNKKQRRETLARLTTAVGVLRGDISRAEYGVRERAKQAAAGRTTAGKRTAEERAKVQAERAAADRDEQVRRENADKVIYGADGKPMDRTLVKFRGRKSTEAFMKEQDETEATNVRGARRTIDEMDLEEEARGRVKRAPLPDERGAQTTKFATAGPLTREQIMSEAPTSIRRAESTLDKDNTPAKRAAAEKLVAQYVENIRIEMDEIDARLKKFYDKRADIVTEIQQLQQEIKEGPQGELLNQKELDRISKPGAKVTREKLEAPRREKFKSTREAQIKKLEGKLEAHDNTLKGIYPIKIELVKLLTSDQKRALRREQLRETQNLDVGMEFADLEASQIKYTQNEQSQLNRIEEAVQAGTMDAEKAGKAREAVYQAALRRSRNRARGPVAREERPIPRSLRTGSPESRAGELVTGVRKPITEKKGPAEKRYPFSGKDAAEANQIASGFDLARKATPEEVAAAKAAENKARAKAIQDSRREARAQNVADKPIKVKRKAMEKVQDRAGEDFEADDEVRLSRGVEGASPVLTDTQVKELEEGNLTGVLADIANDPTADAVHKAVAQRLATLLDNTEVAVEDTLVDAKGEPVLGNANSDGSRIQLSRDGGLSQEVLLHEGTHAAVGRVLEIDEAKLTPVQRTAKRELEALHKAVMADPAITSVTAKTDINEFIAEALSNKVLQDQMAKTKWRMSDAWAGFKSLILRLLGVPNATNMRDAALQSVEALMAPPAAPKAGSSTEVRYAKKAEPALEHKWSPEFAGVGRTAEALVGREKTAVEKVRMEAIGANFRTKYIDKLHALERVVMSNMESLKGLQIMSFLRMYDQRNHFTSLAVTNGVPHNVKKMRADGRAEWVLESKDGANIKDIVTGLSDKALIKAVGSSKAVNLLFTQYLAALRAKRVGAAALDYSGENVTQEKLDAALAAVEGNEVVKDAFEKARTKYNQYNRDLINFAVETGAMAEAQAAELVAADDYIPYYRVQNGTMQLLIGGMTPMRIGDIKSSPHLQELVAGDEKIFDFLTSSVRNTSMLLDMSMRNLAVKNAMIGLSQTMVDGKPLAKLAKLKKPSAVPKEAVEFSDKGERYYAIVDTDRTGISSDLIVHGMEGIPTMLPSIVRIMGGASRLLRRAVVASPIYMARQMFRDTLAAAMTSGADLAPVFSALKEINKQDFLTKRGVTGGQVFSGMPDDVSRMLADLQRGGTNVGTLFAKLEAMSMQADALTRRAQYRSYLEQGLSEMEATYMSLESMNFSKRGFSPNLHFMSTLIPFFNAQIQGLDVLYKALAGKMPMNERLQIREKLITRGTMLMGTTLMYAALMQDDEAYKNAPPEVKYGHWIVRVPGFDEAIKIPIPFELGYIFKAIPEMVFNTMTADNDVAGAQAAQALRTIAMQLIPGGSNYGLPQAIKPLIEMGTNHSFFMQRGIENSQEVGVDKPERYRESTTELAKLIGRITGTSPLMFEHLVRSYTGSMGLAAIAIGDLVIPRDGPAPVERRLSDRPMLSSVFQSDNALGVVSATYDRFEEAIQKKKTYEKLLKDGRHAQAQAYLDKYLNEISLSGMAGTFRQQMGDITQYERAVRASTRSSSEKRAELDRMRQVKIELARRAKAAIDRSTRPGAP